MPQDFLAVLNVLKRYGLKTNSIFHVAILLLPVLVPFLKTMHTLVTSCRSPGIEKIVASRDQKETVRSHSNFPPSLFSTTSVETVSSTIVSAIFMVDLTK